MGGLFVVRMYPLGSRTERRTLIEEASAVTDAGFVHIRMGDTREPLVFSVEGRRTVACAIVGKVDGKVVSLLVHSMPEGKRLLRWAGDEEAAVAANDGDENSPVYAMYACMADTN